MQKMDSSWLKSVHISASPPPLAVSINWEPCLWVSSQESLLFGVGFEASGFLETPICMLYLKLSPAHWQSDSMDDARARVHFPLWLAVPLGDAQVATSTVRVTLGRYTTKHWCSLQYRLQVPLFQKYHISTMAASIPPTVPKLTLGPFSSSQNSRA